MKIEIEKPKDNTVVSEWREYKGADGNVVAKFLIAGNKRPAYLKGLELMQARFEREMAGSIPVTDESTQYFEALTATAGKYLILDWDGIETADGVFKFSPDNAVALLTKTKDGLNIWQWIEAQAKEIQQASDKALNELVGKSSSSTTTAAASTRARKPKPSTPP